MKYEFLFLIFLSKPLNFQHQKWYLDQSWNVALTFNLPIEQSKNYKPAIKKLVQGYKICLTGQVMY